MRARYSFQHIRVICAQALLAFSLSLLAIGLTPDLAQARTSDDTAYVRVIHASPFVGAADVFVDGKALLSNFEFGAVTDYVAIPSGTHHVQVALVGKGINASVITQDLNVTAGTIYTVAALGTAADKLSLQGFIDNNQVAAGQARVRFYQLTPDAASLTVKVSEFTTIPDMPYSQASDYVTANAGSCTLTITDPQSQQTKDLTTTLHANSITSVFSVGLFKGTPAVQLVYSETAGTPFLPQTGSDPTPRTSPMTTLLTVLLAGASIILLASTALFLNGLRKRSTPGEH